MNKAKNWPVSKSGVNDGHIKRGEAIIDIENGAYLTQMDVIETVPTDERLMEVFMIAAASVDIIGLRLDKSFKLTIDKSRLIQQNEAIMIYFRDGEEVKAARLTTWVDQEFLIANIESAIKHSKPAQWVEWRSS